MGNKGNIGKDSIIVMKIINYIFNIDIHNDIFHHIDKQLSAISKRKYTAKDQPYINIKFKNSSDPNNPDYLKHSIALYYPPPHHPLMYIHRYNIGIPNKHFLDEIISVLHEYGHHLSFLNGNNNASEVGLNYNTENNSNKIILNEEILAWEYAFHFIPILPIPIPHKLMLLLFIIYYAQKGISSYRGKYDEK